MLTFKINWNNSDFLNYSVYTGSQYVVCALDDGTVQLLIDGTQNILLFGGNRVYIMNDKGSTIDKIEVPIGNVIPPSKTPAIKNTSNLWVDPSTGRTEERYGG